MNSLDYDNIYLEELNHKYHLKNDTDFAFSSVTEILAKYFSIFDADLIAQKLISTHKDYIGMSVDDLKDKWNKTANFGSRVHKEIEQFILSGKNPSIQMSKLAVDWLNKYCMKGNLKLRTEKIIYSKNLNIAGTIDLIVEDLDTGKYEILDWKTGQYERESYNSKMCNHKITSGLMDCKFEKYTLQLSMYRYLLEKYYDIEVQNQIIAHIFEDECRGYVVPYYKDLIEKIIIELEGN